MDQYMHPSCSPRQSYLPLMQISAVMQLRQQKKVASGKYRQIWLSLSKHFFVRGETLLGLIVSYLSIQYSPQIYQDMWESVVLLHHLRHPWQCHLFFVAYLHSGTWCYQKRVLLFFKNIIVDRKSRQEKTVHKGIIRGCILGCLEHVHKTPGTAVAFLMWERGKDLRSSQALFFIVHVTTFLTLLGCKWVQHHEWAVNVASENWDKPSGLTSPHSNWW